MFTFFNKPRYTDGEITIVQNARFGREPDVGIEKTYCFNIFLNESKRIIGYVDLRVGENEFLYYLGHIGYRINERYRGHHYATKATLLALNKAREENMKRVIITCNPDNIASYKSIVATGATLLEVTEVPQWHELYKRKEKEKCIFEIKLEDNA